MELIVKLWNQLSPEIQTVLKWIFDEHLEETITVLIAFISWLSRRKLGRFINRFSARRTLRWRYCSARSSPYPTTNRSRNEILYLARLPEC